MNKKKTVIVFAGLLIFCFGMTPFATANDYVTYGDVKACFNAVYNGGKAITLQGENEIVATHLPAILNGINGRIVPWFDDQILRYEDAKGIWSSYVISELDLIFWANYFGFTYDSVDAGCKYFMSWFFASYYLDGEKLDIDTTPLKRGQFYELPLWGDEILWWFNEGILYKPCELERGTYNLVTIFYINIPGFGQMIYEYDNIYFDIV